MNAETCERHPVLCVDHEPLHREGLRSRVEREPDLAWAGSLASCEGVVAEAQRSKARVVVMETMVGGGDPFETMRDVVSMCPGTRVIVLSSRIQDRGIDEALKAGALGFFSKKDDPSAVIEGIRTVLRGERAFGPTIQERCMPRSLGSNGRASLKRDGTSNGHANGNGKGVAVAKYNLLTQRERDVLRMIGQGMTRRAIAKVMHRSPKTIDCHRAATMEKLGINDRVELARYAIREGIADVWVMADADRVPEVEYAR